MSPETANHMKWHANGRVNDGLMRHPADSEAWKSFDSKYIEFSSEPRNVRLGLAADGFNPYGNMSTSHSTWPVILILYNLPPWMCMKRRKAKLRTRSKSVTVERASSQDVDEVDQETHEASTQDVQPVVRVTRGPSKYLDIWDLPDEEEIELELNKICPTKNWEGRDHKSRLKKQHSIPDSRNKARVKSNVPTGCISQDWDILVEHWYTDDVVIESKKNKERRSKQDDVHTAGSCSFAVHAAKKAKTDGCPVECSVLYPILHTRKNGSIVNSVVAAKIDKMKELMADPTNHLQSSNTTGSIAWAPDDVFAKVMGKERKGRIRGVGFGPSPSGRSSKNALTDIETHSRQARDNEVAQLKATLATMEEKLADFDEMKEKLAGFDEMKEKLS
ncbi:hypothetical protein SO802_025103 [Lithocarpus litseifolius]|uniref:Transposase n=1 Tax=Lithocarpus litseifolius TaxID=425828 RepID=A0AAW2BXD8_9ROSI